MGAQPEIVPPDRDIATFCREIETYLCRKNDGHLIRVTGPSFDLVAGWAQQGVPLKVAFAGIDRYFERYYRSGPRRRPVRIDFCDADVLDVFDEWRRATGVTGSVVIGRQSLVGGDESAESAPAPATAKASLPAHLQRVVMRLTSARASNALGSALDDLIDRVARELDEARADRGAVRGERRTQLIERLAALDRELLQHAAESLDEVVRQQLAAEAEEDLAPFKAGMTADAFARARQGAVNRLVRERLKLPTIAFHV
jgi:hypothetical protein